MATLGSAQLPAETRIPSAVSTAPVTKLAPRHSALVRVTHWITTICFFALLLTGIEIVISHPRFYWGETGTVLTTPLFQLPIPSSRRSVPTGYGYVLPDQNGWSRALHFEAAWIAVLTGLLYVISGLLTRHFRNDLVPSKADLSWRALLTSFAKPLRFERPSAVEASSYNGLQRLAATAGASGLAVAARLAQKYGLVPPDHGGIYGLGETLTYASQRLLTRHSLAREFPRNRISPRPFPNYLDPFTEDFKRLQAGGFADYRLSIDGMVHQPTSFSIADLKSCPSRSHITELACEEGWSYIAEWIGVPLSHVLHLVGVHPQARYVVYASMEPDTWDSIDMADALHPQTFLCYGMNGNELPVAHGGPLRMRLPRQVGYKNIKFINRLTVTDNLKGFGKGLGSAAREAGYAWYAGI